MDELKNLSYETLRLMNDLEEVDKKLEEANKKLEERDKQLAEDKNLHEINQELHKKKMEEMSKKLEERDKLLYIFNKDSVSGISYKVSSSVYRAYENKGYMGHYYPAGDANGFPVFRKGIHYLYVATDGTWTIGDAPGLSGGLFYQPDKDPTPSTPPRNGWKFGKDENHDGKTTPTVLQMSFITYRVLSTDESQQIYIGDYQPTGEFFHGFPLFRKDWNQEIFVDDISGYWTIGHHIPGISKLTSIKHPDNNPTPSTPPLVGWNNTSFAVIPVSGTYR